MTRVTGLEIETPYGPARAYVHAGSERRAALVLGHGAAGGVEAPDLVAATRAARSAGITVALVEQPYRVAGRAPRPAPRGSTRPGSQSSKACGQTSCVASS